MPMSEAAKLKTRLTRSKRPVTVFAVLDHANVLRELCCRIGKGRWYRAVEFGEIVDAPPADEATEIGAQKLLALEVRAEPQKGRTQLGALLSVLQEHFRDDPVAPHAPLRFEVAELRRREQAELERERAKNSVRSVRRCEYASESAYERARRLEAKRLL